MISIYSCRPSACNVTKSKTPLEEFFKDFTFFLGVYMKICTFPRNVCSFKELSISLYLFVIRMSIAKFTVKHLA